MILATWAGEGACPYVSIYAVTVFRGTQKDGSVCRLRCGLLTSEDRLGLIFSEATTIEEIGPHFA